IVPCGIHGVRMTSLESERVEASWERVLAEVAGGFGAAFGVAVGEVELADLEARGLGLRSVPAGLSSDLA
ncbi:MAG: hypothetical protein R3190_03565, partial [Thermoanaerobaculia bacterium]|nr:hypothetical protein [Thermoanaerobaculia bacterium]